MELRNYNVYFFFAILISVGVLIFFIFKPFLIPFIVAAVLAHLFDPLYRFLFKITGKRKGFSSILVCLSVALIIILPISFIFSLVIAETQEIISNFSSEDAQIEDLIAKGVANLDRVSILNSINIENLINQEELVAFLKNISRNTLALFQSAYQSVTHFVFATFIMFFSLFYLLIDGSKLIKFIMKISPLRDKYEKILLDRFNSIIRATIKGTVLIALLQGLLGGVLFWAVGISSPVLLGILMSLASIIPSVGSGLVWLPVGVIMILIGNPVGGIIILLAGALVISTVDNFIRPKLVGKDTQIHALLILFSTLGGVSFWGISGLFVGPIVMALFLVLWDIYMLEFKNQIKEFNN